MEVTSTGDFISKVEDVNKMNMELEEIDLEQIDEHLNSMEEKRYNDFGTDEQLAK